MTNRVEIFVAIVDRVGKPGFQAGAASAIHDQFKTNKDGFSLVVQGAQTSTAIASVLSVGMMTAGAVPFINIVTNTLAGTVTFLKITADYKDGKTPELGDYMSLIGNVTGVLASFALLTSAPWTAAGFTAIALGSSLFGTYNSDLANNIQEKLQPIFEALINNDSTKENLTPVFTPSMLLTNTETTRTNLGGLIHVLNWHPDTTEITINTKPLLDFLNEQKRVQGSLPPPLSTAPQVPFNDPPHQDDGVSITGSIESLNGRPNSGPTPSLTTVFGSGQDKYACCSAPQQDKYK